MSGRIKSQISQTPQDQSIPRHQGKILVEGIPQTTKDEFKAACARRGKTIRDVVITFMREYVKVTNEELGSGPKDDH